MRHNCPYCRADFEGHPAAKYCSYSCARKAYRRRQRYRYTDPTPIPVPTSAPISAIRIATTDGSKHAPKSLLTPEQIEQLEPADRVRYLAQISPTPITKPAPKLDVDVTANVPARLTTEQLAKLTPTEREAYEKKMSPVLSMFLGEEGDKKDE